MKLSWLKGIKGTLYMAAIFPLVALLISFYISHLGLREISNNLNKINDIILPKIDYLDQMMTSRNNLGYFMWAAISNLDNDNVRSHFIKMSEGELNKFKLAQEKYEKLISSEETSEYSEITKKRNDFFALTEKITLELKKNSAEADANVKKILAGEWHDYMRLVESYGDKYSEKYRKEADDDHEISKVYSAKIQKISIGFFIFTSLALLITVLVIANKLNKRLSSISLTLERSANDVSGAIQQLSSAGISLSQQTTSSAASLEETVASLEELTSMVQMNSDNAKQAASLSFTSKETAERGEQEIRNLIGSMSEISRSSKKIEEIINVIDDIAFQTNLLALNAAVEAARAGEQGKGFAVVAEAVRSLSQRSASAAKDISALIKESVEQIEKGTAMADSSGEVLIEIVNSIKKVSDLNNEISAASQEQSTGIGQISKAMNQLDQAAQNNAATSEEIAASTNEIQDQTVTMLSQVKDLNQVITGENSDSKSKHKQEESESKVKDSEVEKSKVLKFKKTTDKKVISAAPPNKSLSKKVANAAADIIPFDEDNNDVDPRSKIGTTDDF